MIIFVIYAVVVWFYAFKWRRRWGALAVVTLGVAGLLGLWYLHGRLQVWSHGRINVLMLRLMLAPYIVLVTGMGTFVGLLPRRPSDQHCPACEYDLDGLAGAELCPECGGEIDGLAVVA